MGKSISNFCHEILVCYSTSDLYVRPFTSKINYGVMKFLEIVCIIGLHDSLGLEGLIIFLENLTHALLTEL